MSKKVVVAMSGGVDSSVAAALLKEQGYDVVGVTLRLSDWQSTEGRNFGGCCGAQDFFDARAVAQTLDIPHYSFDYVDTFKQSVITYFKDSYLKAETPNPCVACNKHVKFDALLKQTHALGADLLATGHYARVIQNGSQYELHRAVDSTKDQSYVLYHLSQNELPYLMFPVGEYPKTKIREIADKYNLVTAQKPDSQEICFVPNQDYKQFLKEETKSGEIQGGEIRDTSGKVLGFHEGLPFYTIGQRTGLGISVGKPLYVVGLEPATQTLVVGDKEDVLAKTAVLRDVSWIQGSVQTSQPIHAQVKIRYKHMAAPALISSDEGLWKITFDEAQSAITPGQMAVFYEGDRVLGGGVIDHVNS